MSLLCYQVQSLPDLSLNKYQSLADTGVQGVLKRHEDFLRQWHGICLESNTSFHLIYVFLPSEPLGSRLKAYFVLQGDEPALLLVAPLLKSSPLSLFFKLKKVRLPDVVFDAGATLTKKERLADIFNPLTNQITPVHYVPRWEMNEDGRLYDLFKIMNSISCSYIPSCPCAFRIDMYPASEAQATRSSFNPILQSLRGENDIMLLKGTESIKGDSYARDVCGEYEEWMATIETTPHFRVNIYGFADSLFKSKVLLNAAGSESLNEGDFSIAPLRANDENGRFTLLSRMGRSADTYCFFRNNASLSTWSTTFSLSEAVPFFRFPVLFDGESVELPKETDPVQFNDGIYIGKDEHGYPVNFPLKDLPRHAFFTGMPGSGKTNTMLHIVSELRKNSIPFLILEPAKKEYRALLGEKADSNVYLFSPHLQSHFPLQMNPLAFPKGVMLSEHINALLEVFKGSFTLEGPTYKCLSNAIQKAYTSKGWDIEDKYEDDCGLNFPSLQDVYNKIEAEIDAYSYDAELKGNVRAFIEVRLGGLMERDAGELFNTHLSTLNPEEWLRTSAIVELEGLGEDAKNFFVLLVCHYILETLRANPNGGIDELGNRVPVRHAIFIEEAHNIIAPSTQQFGTDSVDPKISSTAYIVKMLAEVRALREAIVIADQLPTALTSEVTKNTGLKLVHRLSSQDDRMQIGSAISASSLQLEQIASFSTGNALIHHERTKKPFEVQVAEWESPDVLYDVSNDTELYENINDREVIQKSVLVAFRNWQNKYLFPISERFQFLQGQLQTLSVENIADIYTCKCEKLLLISECEILKKKCSRLKSLWNFDQIKNESLTMEFKDVEASIEYMINILGIMKFI